MTEKKTPNHELSAMRCPVSLDDVNLFSPGAQEHWFEAYEILHDQAPVHRIPGEGTSPDTDAFILSKYEDLARVVRDPARFPQPRYTQPLLAPSEPGQAPSEPREKVEYTPQMNVMQVSIQSLRPNMELWKTHRQQLTDPWVGPSGCMRHTEMITRTADQLIDRWIDRAEGQVEFVSEFAAPLPQTVMTNVLGFPHQDIPRLADWSAAQVKRFVYGRGHRNLLSADEEEEQVRVLGEFGAYVQEQITRKRREPGDDMISWLCDVTYPALDRKLTDTEINGIVYAMHIGGLETTQYAIAEQAQLLCECPHVWEAIKADRGKIRWFIEEAMRLRSPTQGLSTRMTTQDEVFQGVRVPKGSVLHMRWAAANRDPDEFECPEEFRLDRKSPGRHMTFSSGPRSCPGAGLSRLEQRIAWERLLERVDHLEYAADNKFLHQPGIMLGTLQLHLRFKRV